MDAIKILRGHVVQALTEWQQLVEADNNFEGINLTFAEARAEHILEILRAIDKLRHAS